MKNKFTTYQMTATALLAALMCVLGPVSVPIGPVPISLTNLVVCLAVCLLGAKLATVSVAVYLVLGAVGLPVFSGFSGGLAKLAGPTGGYLIGFLFMAFLAGLLMERFGGRVIPTYLGLVLGCAVDYAFGTAWFVLIMQCDLMYALTICVFPFIVGDLIKMALAEAAGSLLRERLVKAGLAKGLPGSDAAQV